MSLLHYVVPIT